MPVCISSGQRQAPFAVTYDFIGCRRFPGFIFHFYGIGSIRIQAINRIVQIINISFYCSGFFRGADLKAELDTVYTFP